MQHKTKSEYENQLLAGLEVQGRLALLLIHALIGQSAKLNLIRGVIRADGNPNTPGNRKRFPIETDRRAERLRYPANAGRCNEARRLIGRQIPCDDHELVATKTRKGIPRPDRAT